MCVSSTQEERGAIDGDHGLNLAHDHAVVLGLRRGLRVAYSARGDVCRYLLAELQH